MTEKGGNIGRGNNIGKYIPYSNFPSTLREGIEGRGRKRGSHWRLLSLNSNAIGSYNLPLDTCKWHISIPICLLFPIDS